MLVLYRDGMVHSPRYVCVTVAATYLTYPEWQNRRSPNMKSLRSTKGVMGRSFTCVYYPCCFISQNLNLHFTTRALLLRMGVPSDFQKPRFIPDHLSVHTYHVMKSLSLSLGRLIC